MRTTGVSQKQVEDPQEQQEWPCTSGVETTETVDAATRNNSDTDSEVPLMRTMMTITVKKNTKHRIAKLIPIHISAIK